MIQLELPHITALTKSDLISDKSLLESLNELDPKSIIDDSEVLSGKKMSNLTRVLIDMVSNQYKIFNFLIINFID